MLHQWRRADNNICIYCNEVHTSFHLLFDCQHVKPLWEKLKNSFSTDISWQIIITGIALTKEENILITIICFGIYKKFLEEKESNRRQGINSYIHSYLEYTAGKYSHTTSLQMMIPHIRSLIPNLIE